METPVIDLFDPEHMRDPHEIYDELRRRCPVAHGERHGGYWALTRYSDVKAVAQDFRVYSSAETNALEPHDLPKMIPIDMDPPEQRLYRKVLSPRLAKDRVGVVADAAAAHARALIEQFSSAGRCDVVTQFAQPYPMAPIFSIIGIQPDAVMQIFGAADNAVKLRSSDPEGARAGAKAMLEFATDVAKAARHNPGADTLIGDLVDGEVRGKPLTNDEIARYILILLFGGLDTTTNTVVFTINYLADQPALRQRLLSEEGLLKRSIDEFVRLASTVQGLTRLCTHSSELGGQPIAEGERVLMLFGAANRDPKVFDQPHAFDADRDPTLHMGFGAGAHTCLGQHLARVLLEVGVREFLAAIPDYTVVDADPVLKCSEVRGFEGLQISF